MHGLHAKTSVFYHSEWIYESIFSKSARCTKGIQHSWQHAQTTNEMLESPINKELSEEVISQYLTLSVTEEFHFENLWCWRKTDS